MPTKGAIGVAGCAFITTLAEANDVHPIALVTVNEYVFAVNPEIVVLTPDPVIAPGFIVQFPVGNPFKITLPVVTVQVG